MEKRRALRYPIGEQSFEQLRKGGYVYVDKTAYIEKLIDKSKYYFLARPRRFGKSLLLSTLKCFFEGRRDLFSGLHIETMDWDWEKYPVLYLDFNNQLYRTDGEELPELLDRFLSRYETLYEVDKTSDNPSFRLEDIIRAASVKTGREVVILVDEYDKPLVQTLHDPEKMETYRETLAALYSNFKSSADHIKLVVMTGVSRFGKLSVFSDLNNLRDLSFSEDFAAICGITEEEVRQCMMEGVEEWGERRRMTPEEAMALLKEWYDGYHFCENCPDIYNPFSLFSALENKALGNYWIDTGTPTLLVEELKRTHTDLEELMHTECNQSQLQGLDMANINPVALFYQTGYLTIKAYDEFYQIYTLGVPNNEVRQGLLDFILPYYANLGQAQPMTIVMRMHRALSGGDAEGFMSELSAFFAGISYELKMHEETNVQNALYILFHLLGLKAEVEYRTSNGRIDILLRTGSYIYIIELKYDHPAQEALDQIERKGYHLPWATDHRTIYAIGLSYSSAKRSLSGWKIKRLNRP